MLSRFFAIFVLLFSVPVFHAHASEGAIGSATRIEGSVTRSTGEMAEKTALKVGDEIKKGDVIYTSEGGYAEITFLDETSITLNGEEGQLRIDSYIFDPENPKANRARFDILRASFVFVSGALGKVERPNVEIGMDFGTIGIRGTKFLRAMKDDECWVLLKEGKIRVYNDAGSVYLKPDEGTRMSDRLLAPASAKPWSAEKVAWIEGEVYSPEQLEAIKAKVSEEAAKAEEDIEPASALVEEVEDGAEEEEAEAPPAVPATHANQKPAGL